MTLIKDLLEGDHITIQAIVGNSAHGTNANGVIYLTMELKDSSGSINAKKWDFVPNDDQIYATGNIVEVGVDVVKFKESLQLKILSGKLLNPEEIDVTRFVKNPPLPKEEIVARYNKMVSSVKNADCRAMLDYFIKKYKDTLYDAPAAVSVHHEFSSGLIYHSVCIAEIVDYLSSFYKDVNRDLIVTAALLHDMGKLVELEGKAIFKYSTEGKLLGHISIMAAEIRKAGEELKITSEVPMLLEHMILSHHGQMEFGSPVLPLTREALILSIIDSLDSKMLILDKAYEEVKEGEFTNKIFPLDNRMFYKAK